MWCIFLFSHSVVSGENSSDPGPSLTFAGSLQRKETHLSTLSRKMEELTMYDEEEGANDDAPLSQTEDVQAVPLQCGHVLYSVSSRRVPTSFLLNHIRHRVCFMFYIYCMYTETPRPQKGHILPSSPHCWC